MYAGVPIVVPVAVRPALALEGLRESLSDPAVRASRRKRRASYRPRSKASWTAANAGFGRSASSSSVAAPMPACVSEIHDRPSV